MSRTTASNRKKLEFSLDNKTVLDTFAADGWTKSGSGSPLGTWSVDAVDTYNGRSTLKLVTSGTGTGVRDYALKTLSSPINFDFVKDSLIFEMIVKVNDITKISRFYLDLFIGPATTTPNYYQIIFESTGRKWGFNNEYEVFRGTFHNSMNSQAVTGNIRGIRIEVSDNATPITVNFAELSYYKMPTKRAYIVFTNDDGTKSGYDFMHSVMQPLGFTGTFFPSRENIVSGEGGSAGYVDHSEILQLESDGFEIGIHAESGNVSKTATAISFDSASKEIRDSGNGFVTAGFLAGQYALVTGSTKNNGAYFIESVSAGVLKVTEVLTDESVGASVAINAEGFESYTASTLGDYINTQITYLRDTVGVSSSLDTLAYPNGAYGKDSSSFPYTNAASRFRLARVTHEQNTECLVINDPLRVHAGRNMYFSSSNSVAAIKNSIANLISTGGVGVIVSHSIIEAASSSYNYNLTDATTVINFIKTLVDAGKLQVIKFGDIDKIVPLRTSATHRTTATNRTSV